MAATLGTRAVRVGLILLIVGGIAQRRGGSGVIIPERRSEVRGLSQANRRDLGIALAGAIVGAVVSGIAAFIVVRLTE